MGILLQLLSGALGIVGLVCFILVVVQMFKRDESTMGIVCVVTFFCCGIGYLIAFVYGWMKVTAWDLKNIMIAWTIVFVLGAILNAIAFVVSAGNAAATFNEFDTNGGFEIDMGDEFGDMEGVGFPDSGEPAPE